MPRLYQWLIPLRPCTVAAFLLANCAYLVFAPTLAGQPIQHASPQESAVASPRKSSRRISGSLEQSWSIVSPPGPSWRIRRHTGSSSIGYAKWCSIRPGSSASNGIGVVLAWESQEQDRGNRHECAGQSCRPTRSIIGCPGAGGGGRVGGPGSGGSMGCYRRNWCREGPLRGAPAPPSAR